jgi:sugar phosphate permease
LFANSPTALAHSPSIFDLLCAARGMPAEEEAMTTVITQEDASAINWYRELTPVEKRTFWACFGGWALDAMDVQIFSFVIPAIIIAFAITNADAGLIGTVTLLTSAFGGWFAGALADRFGRVRTLQITILWFAFFTLLCGFAQNYTQLLVFRALMGFGFGGEWAAGAVRLPVAAAMATLFSFAARLRRGSTRTCSPG